MLYVNEDCFTIYIRLTYLRNQKERKEKSYKQQPNKYIYMEEQRHLTTAQRNGKQNIVSVINVMEINVIFFIIAECMPT